MRGLYPFMGRTLQVRTVLKICCSEWRTQADKRSYRCIELATRLDHGQGKPTIVDDMITWTDV